MLKKTILVTGAAGFVGSNVVRLLVRVGYDVHAVVKSGGNLWRLQSVKGSLHVHEGLLDTFSVLSTMLEKIHPYGIIHLATYGSYPTQQNTTATIEANILRSLYLFEASRSIAYSRFLVAGSSSEYGKKKYAMSETDVLEPNNLYAVSKAAVTHLSQLEYLTYNKPVSILRLFNVYGPYEEKGRFVRNVIESCLDHKPVLLASGKEARDFIYVSDVAEAFCHALETKNSIEGEVFNIGTGIQSTTKKLAQSVKKIVRSNSPIVIGAYKGRSWDSMHWKANIRKSSSQLGWKSTTTLFRGLQKTIHWYKHNDT